MGGVRWARVTYCLGFWLALSVFLLRVPPAFAATAESTTAYRQAEQQAQRLKKDTRRWRFRHHWLKVLAALDQVAEDYPKSAEAPRALSHAAELWSALAAFSKRDTDLNQALSHYEQVTGDYPKSAYAAEALWQRALILESRRKDRRAAAQEIQTLLQRYPRAKQARAARLKQKQLPAVNQARAPAPDRTVAAKLFGRRDSKNPKPGVKSIRHWSNPVYSRVAIYLSAPAEARVGEMAADPRTGAPARIFLDIAATHVQGDVRPETLVQDDLLEKVRVAEHADGKVRVVLDLKRQARPRLVVMENPYRLVLDALAQESNAPISVAPVATRKHRVVIDPGHGGHDSGAVGHGHTLEKDVVLQISKQVQQMLEASNVEVVLTRSDDTFISLEERTAIANRLGADAFISIHANSAKHGRARGIETYYLNVTDDRYAIRLAAVENKTTEEQVSDLQLILADLSTKVNSQESMQLARQVQSKMCAQARTLNPSTRDLGVKASLFYVLLGARMPSILVETSFVSNREEARLLRSAPYQRTLSRAIANAVVQHLKQPMTLVGP